MAYRYSPAPRPIDVPVQSLLAQVLGLVALGMLVTAIAAYFFQGLPQTMALTVGGFILSMILLFAINGVARTNPPLALLLYYAFTFLMGIWIAPVISIYAQMDGPQVVLQAAETTGLGMLTLAVIVYATSIDFRRFSGIATLALLALILVGFVNIFLHFLHGTMYAWITLGVFTLWTLIDFARIRAGGDGYTPVQMAVQIYLDALNIFLALLQIFGNRRRD